MSTSARDMIAQHVQVSWNDVAFLTFPRLPVPPSHVVGMDRPPIFEHHERKWSMGPA